MDYKIKGKAKHIRKGFVSESAKAFTSSTLSGLGTQVILSAGHDFKVVRMAITYSGDHLVHIKVHKTKYLPREILVILNLAIKFYPHLNGITINSGADQYTTYELSKILSITNITEINLDNTFIKEGNHYILLDKPNKLKILSLARCKLENHAVEKIVAKLEYPQPSSKTLSVLNLSTNHLTDTGALSIAKMLRNNRCLSYLNIAGNMMTDHGIEAILNTLYEFPLTPDETLMFRKRYVNYLKNKQKLVEENMKKVREAEIEKYRIKKKKPGNKTSKESLKGSSSNLCPERVIYEKAVIMTEMTLEEFDDPFGKDTTRKDDVLYSNGNNSLAYLNYAYNNSTLYSTKVLLKVLQHQKKLARIPRGLVNVCLEGNRLPIDDDALFKIESILEAQLKEKETSQNKKKKESATNYAK